MRRVMLVLVGLGALSMIVFVVVFVIARAQPNKEQCDEKQYDDFLSEVRNWEERAKTAWRTGNTDSLNHDRVSDISKRRQPDFRVWEAQRGIVRKMDQVEFTLSIYKSVERRIEIIGRCQTIGKGKRALEDMGAGWEVSKKMLEEDKKMLEEGKKMLEKDKAEEDSKFNAYLAAERDLADAIRTYTSKSWEWDTKRAP